MRVTFTISKQDAEKHQWQNWTRSPLRLTLRLCALPVLAYYICRFGGLDTRLTTVVVCVLGIVPAAALFLAFLDLFRKISAAGKQSTSVRVAEIGENDFRFGLLESFGHFYHWTRFEDIQETNDSLYFVLSSAKHLRIPKTAFPEDAAAQIFLAEARNRWQAALLTQDQRQTPHDETVWPPPPRSGASPFKS